MFIITERHGLAAAGRQAEYVLGVQDVLSVTVFGVPELSGKFTVEADGTVKLPFIDRVRIVGLTSREVEEELKKALAKDLVRNPQVAVAIDQYRSQRVFVHGEVRQPGPYTLTGESTLLEVLTKAGSVTPDAGDDVLVVRATGSGGSEGARVERFSLGELQDAPTSGLPIVRDGDTVNVPRGERVYISGHVRLPGAYIIRKGTTVRQAVTLAGGFTERAAQNRIKILRTVDQKEVSIDGKLESVVLPGDTVVVPERWF